MSYGDTCACFLRTSTLVYHFLCSSISFLFATNLILSFKACSVSELSSLHDGENGFRQTYRTVQKKALPAIPDHDPEPDPQRYRGSHSPESQRYRDKPPSPLHYRKDPEPETHRYQKEAFPPRRYSDEPPSQSHRLGRNQQQQSRSEEDSHHRCRLSVHKGTNNPTISLSLDLVFWFPGGTLAPSICRGRGTTQQKKQARRMRWRSLLLLARGEANGPRRGRKGKETMSWSFWNSADILPTAKAHLNITTAMNMNLETTVKTCPEKIGKTGTT